LDEKNEKRVRILGAQFQTGSGAYDHAYDDTMKRIEQQSSFSQDLAKRILGWVTFSARPLTAIELQDAIAVEIGEPEFDQTNIIDIEEMISVCSGLIVVEENSNIAKLVHYTAQEYLKRTCKSWYPDVHEFLTDTCLTYLSFDNFGDPCLTQDGPKVQRGEYPFYQYSAHELGTHLHKSLGKDSLLPAFIGNDAKVSRCMREIFGLSGTECGFTGLHLASLFGLEHIVEGFSHTGSNFDIWDYLGRTPLIWAAGSGNETVVSLLLGRGAHPNSATKESFTPLFYAAAYGHAAVVRLLIDGGADVNFKNKSNETPVFFAAKGGSGVRLGPRSLFSMGDHALVIKLLIDAGANLDHENVRHETPLHAAANNGHEVAVRLLLERNANINSYHSNYCGLELIPAAPLTAAARKGHVKITKLLLESGADTPFLLKNTNLPPSSYALSCLSKSAIGEDESSFTAILQESDDPSFRDEFERLPLHWAASRGDGILVQRILKAGCNPNPKDIFGRTPLFAAVCRDRVNVVKVLLDHPDIDAQSEDKLGFTPLQESCRRQRSSNKVYPFMREPFMRGNSAGPWDEVTNLLKVKTGLRDESLLNANVPLFPREFLPQGAFYNHCDFCLDKILLGGSRVCASCNMITKKDGTSGGTVIYCGLCIQGVKDCPLCGQSF
jgi:ankyrin repeat protein